MIPKLTDEMRQALQYDPDRPVKVEDEQTHRVYVLVSDDAFREMVDEELRRQLQIGLDQADRGEFVDWDPDKIKAEGREILQRRPMTS